MRGSFSEQLKESSLEPSHQRIQIAVDQPIKIVVAELTEQEAKILHSVAIRVITDVLPIEQQPPNADHIDPIIDLALKRSISTAQFAVLLNPISYWGG